MVYKSNFWLRHQSSPNKNTNTRKNNVIRQNTQPLVFASVNTPRSNITSNNKMVFKPIRTRPSKRKTRKNHKANRR